MLTAAPNFLRPSVQYQEFDLTQKAAANTGSIGCITGEFRKGPLKPTYVGSRIERFYQLYGDRSDPSLSFAHDSAAAFLSGSSQLLLNRAVNGDLHAGLDVFLDEDETYGSRMLLLPHKVGDLDGYEGGWAGPTLLKFDDVLITSNEITLNVTDGTTVEEASVTFATSHAATMAALAAAIKTKIDSFGSGGNAYVYQEPSSNTAASYTIVMIPPKDADVSFNTPAVASGASQATASLITPSSGWFGTVLAENPGEWANDLGIKVNNFNEGTRERWRLTFSAALVASNSFSMSLNLATAYPPASGNVGPVTFSTDSDTTMAAIATAIKANALVRNAWVETTAGGVSNDRTIVVEAETPGLDYLIVNGAAITGGASQAIISIAKVLTGTASDGSFVVEVFDRSAPVYPIERHQVTPYAVTSGNGGQLKYETVINGASGSSNIRFIMNPAFTSAAGFATPLGTILGESFALKTAITWLAGGTNGSAVLSSQLVTALGKLEDRVRYPVSMMINAGYTNITVQQALTALCEQRGDCTAILDMPTAHQKTGQIAREYRLYELNINSSYAALYSPDLLIADLSTGEQRYVPPSGHVAAAYAYNDRVAALWAAPAGFNRGRLTQVLGLRYEYSPSDEELMHPNGINAIVNRPAVGPVIMGEETLQAKKSALSSVHIRRLLNDVRTRVTDGLDYTLFEPNTESTRFQAIQLGNTVLEPIHRRDGLYDYLIKCDDDNNTSEVIDADALAYDVYVKPVRAIKGILLRMVITRTGASFQEIVADFNGALA